MIELERINTFYGLGHILHDLSLRVGESEVVALLGRNGAGKTTTLRTIMGLMAKRSGSVRVGTEELANLPAHLVPLSGVAYVPQGRRLFSELTVDENLRLGLQGRRSRDGAEEDVEQAAALFPVVREARDRPAGVLSGGQQQQLAIARSLVAQPSVLLLDEPSLGLAPNLVELIFETILEISRSGASILLVEQNASMALEIASRGYVLETGRVALSGSAAELKARADFVEAYLG